MTLRSIAHATLLVSLAALTLPAAGEPCTELGGHDLERLKSLDFDEEESAVFSEEVRRELADPMVTGTVRVVRQPIFNTALPAEDKWLFRAANRLHVDTRERALRDLLLFEPGEPVTIEQLEETERLLRARPYLYDARVVPRRICGNVLDVDVVTRDVWTLLPRLDFDRAGGDNSYSVGIMDSNVLGSGQNVSVGYRKNQDRSGVDFSYEDPNVRGSRTALALYLENADDGSRQLLDVRRPFFSFDSRYALGTRLDNFDRDEGLYQLGQEVSEFRQDTRFVELFGGWSRGRQPDDRVGRWRIGYTYEDHSFDRISGVVAPDPFPQDRTYAYPWIGYESVRERFETMRNFDRFHRTEDLNLGRSWFGRLGWSDHVFGGDDQSRLALGGGYFDATRIGERHLYRYGLRVDGFWNFDADEEQDVVTSAYGRYNFERSEHRAFAAALDLTYVRNLPVDRQLLLGGDTGLRGYPSRYQAGDRRVLVTVEERFFTDFYPFRLARVGYVLFADAGRAWDSDSSSSDGYGVLADVGVGLRLESTRTRSDRILHLDFAFPLVDGPDVSAMEILFRVKAQL